MDKILMSKLENVFNESYEKLRSFDSFYKDVKRKLDENSSRLLKRFCSECEENKQRQKCRKIITTSKRNFKTNRDMSANCESGNERIHKLSLSGEEVNLITPNIETSFNVQKQEHFDINNNDAPKLHSHQRKINNSDTPLSSKAPVVDLTSPLSSVISKISNETEEAQLENEILIGKDLIQFKHPSRPMPPLKPLYTGRMLTFDDLNTGDETEDDNIEIDITKFRRKLLSWSLLKNRNQTSKIQNFVDSDVCDTFFCSKLATFHSQATIFPSSKKEDLDLSEKSD
ncbi:CLUMA_CG014409, isoform A [Clunio marinus]|uniref:CLUMA_CG014409, isoform A n=1 Tax=Clunio marinus TaxID=568069 RepID=A0A1J1ILG5_9DIPT|nr:CLUMA_CG014409, isoform A [Clunio marinus]